MQNRLKDADEKNSILLKALNDTFGKLSAIPNGKLEKRRNAHSSLLFSFVFHPFTSVWFIFTSARAVSTRRPLWPLMTVTSQRWAAWERQLNCKQWGGSSLCFGVVKGTVLRRFAKGSRKKRTMIPGITRQLNAKSLFMETLFNEPL